MKSTASFERRLNKDADLRKLERGQYRSARNARVGTSQESNVGTLESAPSNSIFSGSYTFPAGTNKCIGACADIKNNAIIYCFYNSNGNHRILKWDADTNTITDILDTDWTVSVLGWTSTSRLWNMRIVESGTDQIMFFHEVQGLPRRINLGIISQRTTGAYTLTEDDISVARKPPHNAPTLEYDTDTSFESSFIQNKFFQFRYRFIYENNEQSTWSPWSELSIPPQDGVLYNKIIITFNSGVKGVSKVEIARREGNGSSDTGSTNPTLYIFNTWVKGANSDDTNYTVDFFNTEVLTPISVASSNKLFDQVPQLVGCQEVVQSNQIIYGDITEGYDNLASTNVQINQTFDTTGILKLTTEDNAGNYRILVGDFTVPAVGDIIYIQIGNLVFWTSSPGGAFGVATAIATVLNKLYAATATVSGTNVDTTIPYASAFLLVYSTPNPNYKSTTIIDWIKTGTQTITAATGYQKVSWDQVNINGVDKINATDFKFHDDSVGAYVSFGVELYLTFVGVPVVYNVVLLDVDSGIPIAYYQFTQSSGGNVQLAVNFNVQANSLVGKTLAIALEGTSAIAFTINTGGTNQLTTTFAKGGDVIDIGFKSGATHSFGLVYFDKYMRQCGVQAISKSYINYPTQRTYGNYYNSVDEPTEGYVPQLDWEIKHLPPSWAYYYTWVYDGGNIQNYAQIAGIIEDTSTDITGTTILISSNNLYKYKFMYNSFSVGDKCRLLLKRGTLYENYTYFSTIQDADTDYIEAEIVAVSSTHITVQTTNTDFNYSNVDSCLLEIYALTKSELFFEQTIYEIGNPTANNRYHKGPNQNQNPSDPIATPAKGDFLGNTYFRLIPNQISDIATPSVINNPYVDYLTESNSITYNAESNYWNKGRPHIETPDQKQMRIKWMYRWGNQLLQDTQVNGMSTFDSGNYGVLSARYGALTAMREVGYTLKMIQEANYNTAFIQRRQIQNADGSTQLVVTDSLIGSVNPSEDLYGTKYPGSVCVNGRNVYWLDTIKGKVIRESGNSPFPISDYGMVKYWRDAALTIDSLGYEVFSGFDKQTEQLFITYKRTGADVFTLSFYDPERDGIEKGWVCDQHDFTKVISSVVTPIDMYGWVGQIFTSALAGGLYKHNVGSSYLQLYGEQKTMSVSSAFVLDPEQMTVFLAHWVRANKAFAGTIFTIPAGPQTPNGMRTLLVPGNYVTRENVFYSEIKRDGYTKGVYADDSNTFITQMLEGRVMRGHVCLAEISYASSTIFILYSHAIADEYSPLS